MLFHLFSVYLDPNLVIYPGKVPRKEVLDTVLHGLAFITGTDFKTISIQTLQIRGWSAITQ